MLTPRLSFGLCLCFALLIGLAPRLNTVGRDTPAAATLPTLRWSGSQSDRWDDRFNWSPAAAPTGQVNCLIPSGLSRYPRVAAGASAVCGGILTVESGASLVVEAEATLTVEGAQITGALQLGPASSLSAAREIRVAPGGFLQQQGGSGADILFREANGRLTIEGVFALAGPVQIDAPGLTGQLTVNPGGLVDLNGEAALGVSGSLRNFGAMRQSRPVDLSLPSAQYLHVTSRADGTGGLRYEGVAIDLFLNEPLGMTTVTVWGAQNCDSSDWARKTVQRCYEIQPSLPGRAYVTFFFRQFETNLQNNPVAYRLTDTGWEPLVGGANVAGSGEARYVRVSAVSQFGKFSLHDVFSPVIWTYFPGVLR